MDEKRSTRRLAKPLLAVIGIGCIALAVAACGTSETVFTSDQLRPVEEAAKVRTILEDFDGTVSFLPQEGGPLIDQITAENTADDGTIHVVGSTHGTFPSLDEVGALADVGDLVTELSEDRDFSDSLVQLANFNGQKYVPWLQAVYIMAAHTSAMQDLPAGADINNLTYDQFIQWGRNMEERTGSNQIGFPAGDGGLMHRFIHGYIYPAYTGSVVTEFRSADAVDMWEKFREMWEVVSPQSTTYSFMQEPLMRGEVLVAFDHTARLANAFKTGDFVPFPAPRGPEGRWYLPVAVGVGIPTTTPDRGDSEALIDYLTTPSVQAEFFNETGWVPVASGSGGGDLVGPIVDGINAQAAVGDAGVFPQGLGDRGGEFSGIYRDAFREIVLNNADIEATLETQGDKLETLFSETDAACWAPDTGSAPCPVND